VLLVLALRYRKPRPTLAAFLPALLACGVTVGALGLLGEPVSLVHVLTLLLVVSMGVDYGVFMVESRMSGSDATQNATNMDAGEDPAHTLVALFIACTSTVCSFGALALSSQPLLHAMGLTAAIGVLASLVLAPISLQLVRARE
jgi:predicted exporter